MEKAEKKRGLKKKVQDFSFFRGGRKPVGIDQRPANETQRKNCPDRTPPTQTTNRDDDEEVEGAEEKEEEGEEEEQEEAGGGGDEEEEEEDNARNKARPNKPETRQEEQTTRINQTQLPTIRVKEKNNKNREPFLTPQNETSIPAKKKHYPRSRFIYVKSIHLAARRHHLRIHVKRLKDSHTEKRVVMGIRQEPCTLILSRSPVQAARGGEA